MHFSRAPRFMDRIDLAPCPQVQFDILSSQSIKPFKKAGRTFRKGQVIAPGWCPRTPPGQASPQTSSASERLLYCCLDLRAYLYTSKWHLKDIQVSSAPQIAQSLPPPPTLSFEEKVQAHHISSLTLVVNEKFLPGVWGGEKERMQMIGFATRHSKTSTIDKARWPQKSSELLASNWEEPREKAARFAVCPIKNQPGQLVWLNVDEIKQYFGS